MREKAHMKKSRVIYIIVVLVLLIVLILSYFRIIRLPDFFVRNNTTNPVPPIKVTSTAKPFDQEQIAYCTMSKKDNPLIDYFIEAKNKKYGTFRGNINSIEKHTKEFATLEILSVDAKQSYKFTARDEKGMVYDSVKLKDITLQDLKKGMTVALSFTCDKEATASFKINQIAITGQ